MWFDHHLLTDSNEKPPSSSWAASHCNCRRRGWCTSTTEQDPDDPDLLRLDRLVDETDRLDAALLTPDDVENPRDYILLGYTIDSRTGLGSFDDYFRKLAEWLKTMPIRDVLQQPEVRERVERIRGDAATFKQLLSRNSFQLNNVVVTDLREIERFPRATASSSIRCSRRKRAAARALGSAPRHGRRRRRPQHLQLHMQDLGRRAHVALWRRRSSRRGTCVLPLEKAADAIDEILFELQANGDGVWQRLRFRSASLERDACE
jgi:hypothetical protein